MEEEKKGNLVVEESENTPKQTMLKRKLSKKFFFAMIPAALGLFVLVFFLANQLTAGKKNEIQHQGVSPVELLDAQSRINNLKDKPVSDSGSEGGSKSESYVNSILQPSVETEIDPESSDLDPDMVLNSDIEQSGSMDADNPEETSPIEVPNLSQKESAKSIENEPSMIVFSRIKGAAGNEDQGKNSDVAVKPSMEEASKQKPNYGKPESPLQAIIYNDAPPVRVFEGEYIEGEIVNRIESGVADSPVIATVIKDYFDRNQRYVVIPAGTRIVGEAGSVVRQDQTRLILAFHRLILPNEQSVLVSKEFKGLSADGRMGVKSKVNEHLFKRYGSTLLFGVLSGLGAFAQNKIKQTSGASFFVDRASTNFEQINNHLFQQYSNISPTITVKAGHKVTVYISEDFMISPYMAIKERGYAK